MTDDVLLDTTEKAFATVCTFEAVQEAQARGWAPEVWDVAASIGLPWIGVPETAGGAGGTLEDALAVLQIAGAHAAPIPLAETGILAGWLLTQAGLGLGDEPLTVVPGRQRGRPSPRGRPPRRSRSPRPLGGLGCAHRGPRRRPRGRRPAPPGHDRSRDQRSRRTTRYRHVRSRRTRRDRGRSCRRRCRDPPRPRRVVARRPHGRRARRHRHHDRLVHHEPRPVRQAGRNLPSGAGPRGQGCGRGGPRRSGRPGGRLAKRSVTRLASKSPPPRPSPTTRRASPPGPPIKRTGRWA